MALDPTTLAQQLYDSEIEAQGGVTLPADVLARIRTKCDAQAAAIHAFVIAGTVTTQVTVQPGQVVQVAPATGTGSTTSPGSGAGTGSIT